MTDNYTNKDMPDCQCGKCIVIRERKDHFTSLPYSKNTNSTYNIDYPWKQKIKEPEFYNLSKHCSNDTAYKENLPNILQSHTHATYRPTYKINKNNNKLTIDILHQPFIGHTTNEILYPNWGLICSVPNEDVKSEQIKIPFRGKSTYNVQNKRYDNKYYKRSNQLCFGKDSLRFYGVIPTTSISQDSYKPYNLNNSDYYNMDKFTSKSLAFLEPKLPNDYLKSTYSNDYIEYDDSKCDLKKNLKKTGNRELKI